MVDFVGSRHCFGQYYELGKNKRTLGQPFCFKDKEKRRANEGDYMTFDSLPPENKVLKG